MGCEGKSCGQSNQDEPTGSNHDVDLRDDDVVSCWFVSVGLLHRNFIAFGWPCGCNGSPGCRRPLQSARRPIARRVRAPRAGHPLESPGRVTSLPRERRVGGSRGPFEGSGSPTPHPLSPHRLAGLECHLEGAQHIPQGQGLVECCPVSAADSSGPTPGDAERPRGPPRRPPPRKATTSSKPPSALSEFSGA